jgi:homogentisate phytyltransferase/homogentisate geranylgeranyltransferase
VNRPPATLRSVVPRWRAIGVRDAAGVLWRFGRPHTIIGTTVSVLGLYAIAVSDGGAATGPVDLACTLLAGWCVNVFIVGVNQIEDVAIDRINKPWLPIAAGDLAPGAARAIVTACAIVPVSLAATQGPVELGAVAVALVVGWAYSCPPLRLKRYAAPASLSIAFVRTLVVNLGVWLHFAPGGVSPAVWALTAFSLPYSLAIAILKDVPDVRGDRRFDIATFSVRLGARPVFATGLALLTLAEVGMAVAGAVLLDGVAAPALVAMQLAAAALLWWWAAQVDLVDEASVARFYQRVWKLFFCEYAMLPAAYLLG